MERPDIQWALASSYALPDGEQKTAEKAEGAYGLLQVVDGLRNFKQERHKGKGRVDLIVDDGIAH